MMACLAVTTSFQVEPIGDDVLFAAFSESSTHGLGTFGKFIEQTSQT